MFYPKFEKVAELAKDYDLIPIALDLFADTETPVSIFKKVMDISPYCFLLDSVEGGEKWARYSFIGTSPLMRIKIKGDIATITNRDGSVKTIKGNPYKTIQDIMQQFKGAKVEGIERFTGGAVGFFGYDLVRSCEYLPNTPKDDLDMPDCHFMIADEVIAFDHLKQKITLIVNMPTNGDLNYLYDMAKERLLKISHIIKSGSHNIKPSNSFKSGTPHLSAISNMSKEYYCNMVKKAKDYIVNGDIFQVVLSRRFSMPCETDSFLVYRLLRVTNPSPYMYYLKFDDYCIAGASPEMLVRCENGIVETCPIAGTRKRGENEIEDNALEKELLADEKELAEHTMLVDLGRNDIGKVSEFGSVQVTEYMKVVKYSHVMHIVSLVQGKLKEGLNAFDALMALLPAGTLSGAPKIRAMEIIDEMELTKRGIYGGAIGYISFNGNLDSCITIRTILFKNGIAYIQAGAGIVADSVPEKEFEETENKAMALIRAIEGAENIN